MTHVLDTDTCIWVIREKQPFLNEFQRYVPTDLAITSTTEAELRFGALKSGELERNLTRLMALLATGVDVLPFDRAAARHHAEVRHALRAQPIGDRDLVIASVALANGATLVTGNVREFGRVPGLRVEDWGVTTG